MKNELEILKKVTNTDKKLVFACIGTEASYYDGIAPRIGTFLEQIGQKVYGKLGDNINQQNYIEKINYIKKNHFDDFIIAIDLCYLEKNDVFIISNEPVHPAKYSTKNNTVFIGNASIMINVYPFLNTNSKEEILKKICYDSVNVDFSRAEKQLKVLLKKFLEN